MARKSDEKTNIDWDSKDWLGDPAVLACTPATRGVWFDLLNVMHLCGRMGELIGTAEELARRSRCSTAELVQALTELQTTGAADIVERNGTWTVRNRRMRRDAAARKSNAERQKRFRDESSNDGVTPDVTPLLRCSNSDPTLSVSPDHWESFLERIKIPETLESPLVRSALLDWLRYKAKRGERYKDPDFVSRKVAEFTAAGVEAFVAAVNSSIGNNYAGLFPAKAVQNGSQPRSNRVGRGQRFRE